MNELFFSGYGYFKVKTNDIDDALEKLSRFCDSIGLEIIPSEAELRDPDGDPIESRNGLC